MKNNNKGFTLIELLVVVAIIGILAAVGTVAYTGYTGAAKKNSSKSIHANAVKYVASELAKCNLDSTLTIFDAADAVDCDSTATEIVTMLIGTNSPMQDKNPYDSSLSAITGGTTTGVGEAAVTTCEEGYTCLAVPADAATTISISTNWNDVTADVLTNKLEVE